MEGCGATGKESVIRRGKLKDLCANLEKRASMLSVSATVHNVRHGSHDSSVAEARTNLESTVGKLKWRPSDIVAKVAYVENEVVQTLRALPSS